MENCGVNTTRVLLMILDAGHNLKTTSRVGALDHLVTFLNQVVRGLGPNAADGVFCPIHLEHCGKSFWPHRPRWETYGQSFPEFASTVALGKFKHDATVAAI